MKISNKKELQNIVVNHSTDIDYKDFMKIYRECTNEPCSFLTTDVTLPASDPPRFRKKYFNLIKTTVSDQIKILHIKVNQKQRTV